MAADLTRTTLDLDAELHRAVRVQAVQEGVPMVEIARALFRLWLADEQLRDRVREVQRSKQP